LKDGPNPLEGEGSYKGQDGCFEWIVENDKTINHRLFMPKL